MNFRRFVSVLLPVLIVLFSQPALAKKWTNQVEPAATSGLILEIDAGYSSTTVTGLTIGKKLSSKNHSILSLGLYGKAAFAMSIWDGIYGGNFSFLLKFHLNFGMFMISPFLGAGLGIWGVDSGWSRTVAFPILLNAGLAADWFVTNKFYVGIEGSLDHTIMTGPNVGFAGTIGPAMALHFGFKL